MKTHQKCPDCGHNKCLTIFDDGGSYCHSCGEARSVDLKKIIDSSVEDNSIIARGIEEETIRKFGCSTLSMNGKPVVRVYRYPDTTKYRVFPKRMWMEGPTRYFFGQDLFAPGRGGTIVITEGEEDAMASWQMSRVPSIGCPGALASRILIDKNRKYLDAFDRIVVFADNDDTGKNMAKVFYHSFPGKVYQVKSDYKDANDWLLEGDPVSYKIAIHKAPLMIPSDMIHGKENILKKAMEKEDVIETIPTGFMSLDDKINGIPLGFLTIITGQEGIGKTEFMRRLEYSVLENDRSVGIIHLEETERMTINRMSVYHGEGIEAFADRYGDNITVVTMHENEHPLDVVNKIRYMNSIFGVDVVFIDPIQQLAYDKDIDNEEKVLTRLSIKLSKLASELDMAIVCSTHVNDDGQVRSSRMIAKSAGVRIDLVNNSETEDNLNISFHIRKNRPFANRGLCGYLEYDKVTGKLREREEVVPF